MKLKYDEHYRNALYLSSVMLFPYDENIPDSNKTDDDLKEEQYYREYLSFNKIYQMKEIFKNSNKPVTIKNPIAAAEDFKIVLNSMYNF